MNDLELLFSRDREIVSSIYTEKHQSAREFKKWIILLSQFAHAVLHKWIKLTGQLQADAVKLADFPANSITTDIFYAFKMAVIDVSKPLSTADNVFSRIMATESAVKVMPASMVKVFELFLGKRVSDGNLKRTTLNSFHGTIFRGVAFDSNLAFDPVRVVLDYQRRGAEPVDQGRRSG